MSVNLILSYISVLCLVPPVVGAQPGLLDTSPNADITGRVGSHDAHSPAVGRDGKLVAGGSISAELPGELDRRPAEARSKDYVETHAGMNLEMTWIPAGTLQMGSELSAAELARKHGGKPESFKDESPLHAVELDGFWLGKHELTQHQYEALMGSNPSMRKSPLKPLEAVTWEGAASFCAKLSAATGRRYTLPNEAQWEYACRAGGRGQWCFGDDPSPLDEYAWHIGNSGHGTHPVGLKLPNAWGLHDMHGNVGEWCNDWYGAYGVATTRNPSGPSIGARHVVRGGTFYDDAAGVRSAKRGSLAVDPKAGWTWCGGVGFRVCCVPNVPAGDPGDRPFGQR